jgi:hypothetical protein
MVNRCFRVFLEAESFAGCGGQMAVFARVRAPLFSFKQLI